MSLASNAHEEYLKELVSSLRTPSVAPLLKVRS